MNRYSSSICALAAAFIAPAMAEAQTVDIVALIRGEEWLQTDANTLEEFPWDPPYLAEAVIEVSAGTIADASLGFGGISVPLEYDGESYWGEDNYETAAEMAAAWPSGTYTVSGVGSTVGSFSLSAQLDDYTPQQKKKVLNWQALQSVDPAQPVTVEWEAFSDAGEQGLVFVEISYYVESSDDSVDIWEAPGNRTDGLPGLAADSTSVEIPAGILQGSAHGLYDVTIEFIALESAGDPAPFNDALFVTGTVMRTHFQLQTSGDPSSNLYLDQWAVTTDGWADTQGWMGWLYVNNAPWAFSHSLNKYVYVAEGTSSQSGAWIYSPRSGAVIADFGNLYLDQWAVTADGWTDTQGWMGRLYVNNAPWVYSEYLGKYVYIAEGSFSQSGAWIYASRPAAE